jgi:acetyltransferase
MNDFKFDPSLDVLHKQSSQLDLFFYPKNVAVIGASEKENSVGRTLLWNLLRSPFGGTIYPVNPKRKSVLGIKAYAKVSDIPETVDLAIIATPAKTVPNIISSCVDANITAAIIISAGFKELGESGAELEREVLAQASRGNMRIIGPNCLGIMNPITGLNATFASDVALKGNIAFISQSGALCTAVLDWSIQEKVGFSSFVSIGSLADINWGDLINYFGNDPNTHSILIYMETVGDARSFLSAAREVSITKPIILIKAGVTEESAKAASSHTGALSGSDDVLNASLRRVGVLRVDTISDLFNMAEILSKQPKPTGPNLSIITNAGGPGVIATDALVINKGELTSLTEETYNKLNAILPKEWSHNNPVDILGDASPELYAQTVKIVSEDPNSDGILVILTPQYMTDPTLCAEALKPYSANKTKPILASWMGASTVNTGTNILIDSGIPTFSYPDMACRAFAYMWAYSYNLKGIYETPILCEIENENEKQKKKEKVSEIFLSVREEGRTLLTEYEAKKVLEIIGIPIVKTSIATNKDEAIKVAEEMGFPVVLKLHSKEITHKTDVGGVKLNLNNKEAVEKAFTSIYESLKALSKEKFFDGVTVQKMINRNEGYELIIGSSLDSQFGPVLLFGSGGELVEVYKDKALSLPPLTNTLARRMMEQTKIYEALKGVRGKKAVDLIALEKILVNFSLLIAEFPQIVECDINPLLVSSKEIISLDARIVLSEETEKEKLPKLAIRPYPINYIKSKKLKDGSSIVYRPIRPEDEPLILSFLQDLSEKSVLQRYLEAFHYNELLERNTLISFCFNDYDREIAIVAEKTMEDGKKEILAVGRLTKIASTDMANFALIVKDKCQGEGIGSSILSQLIVIAKEENIEKIVGTMRKENVVMQKICEKHNFTVSTAKDSSLLQVELKVNN